MFNYKSLSSPLLIFSLAACTSEVQNESCYRYVDKQKFFFGSEVCLSRLDLENISGFWIVGFEYSVFVSSYEEFKSYEPDKAYWLTVRHNALHSHQSWKGHKFPALYKVEFSGYRSTEKGFYSGDPTDMAGGILVDEFKSITLIEEL